MRKTISCYYAEAWQSQFTSSRGSRRQKGPEENLGVIHHARAVVAPVVVVVVAAVSVGLTRHGILQRAGRYA
jgi:hypothetical protein